MAAACPQCGNRTNRVKEFLTDPGSKEFSPSRLVFLVVNLVYIPLLFYLTVRHGINFSEVVKLILGLNAAPALIYGGNSVSNAIFRWANGKDNPQAQG